MKLVDDFVNPLNNLLYRISILGIILSWFGAGWMVLDLINSSGSYIINSVYSPIFLFLGIVLFSTFPIISPFVEPLSHHISRNITIYVSIFLFSFLIFSGIVSMMMDEYALNTVPIRGTVSEGASLSHIYKSIRFFLLFRVLLLLYVFPFGRWLFESEILGRSSSTTMEIHEAAEIVKGMLTNVNEVDLNRLAQITDTEYDEWELRIYRLLGRGDISGSLEEGKFILDDTKDIDTAIDQLLQEFDRFDSEKI